MKNKLTIILILISQIIYAQNKGYYITNNGEKHSCLIKGYYLNDKVEDFKYLDEKDSNRYIHFNIKDIKEFGVDKLFYFVRYKVKAEFICNDDANLDSVLKTNLENKTLFLKKIVEGKLNLYSYYYNINNSNNNTLLFISKDNQTPEQLYFKRIHKYRTDTIRHYNRYKIQLRYLTNNDKHVCSKLHNLQYKYKPIVKLVTNYNKSVKQLEYSEKQLWPKWIKLNIEGGISYSFFSSNYKTFSNFSSLNHSISGSFEFKFKRLKYINFLVGTTYRNIQQKYIFDFRNNTYNINSEYKGFDLFLGIKRYFKINKNSKTFIEFTYQPTHIATYGNHEVDFIDLSNEGKYVYLEDFKTTNMKIKEQISLDHSIGLGFAYIYRNLLYSKIKFYYYSENFYKFNTNYRALFIEFSLGIKI